MVVRRLTPDGRAAADRGVFRGTPADGARVVFLATKTPNSDRRDCRAPRFALRRRFVTGAGSATALPRYRLAVYRFRAAAAPRCRNR